MSQGITIKGKSPSGQNVEVRVDENGRIIFGSENTDGSIATSSPALAVRLDDATTPGITYVGKAPLGATPSASVWQIAKLDTSSGLIKTWADADALYDNVWNNRASLTYS